MTTKANLFTKKHAVCVIGMGLVGKLLAFRLASEGYRVKAFDARHDNDPPNASMVAAGMLASYAELEKSPLEVFDWGDRARKLWHEWLLELDASLTLEEKGSLLVAHRGEYEELLHYQSRINRKINEKLPILENLGTIEPGLSHFKGSGIFLPSEASLPVERLLGALDDFLLRSPLVEYHKGVMVAHLSPYGIRTESESTEAAWVFDARGIGAMDDIKDLRPVRGEILELEAFDVSITRMVRFLHPRYRLYLQPKGNGRFLIGASEVEAYDKSPVSVRSSLELLTACVSLHPGFLEARIIASRVGIRAAFSDNTPKIVHEAKGLTRINGLYRHGYLVAPYLVDQALRFDA